MSISFTASIDGERFAVAMPDASAITVPSVARAAVEAQAAAARISELTRERNAADAAIDTAKHDVARRAAELAIKKKDLPKDIRRSIKDAQENAEHAALALGAAMVAFRHCYATLIAEVNANRPALEQAALKSAEQSLQRMAAARAAFDSAAGEAYASFGLLGMFSENDRTGLELIKYRDPKGSRRGFHVSGALEAMGQAVGHSNLELIAYKRGEAPTKRELEAATDGEG